MSTSQELLEAFDKGIAAACKALNELRQISVDNEDLLAIYEKLTDRAAFISDLQMQRSNLAFAIGAERHHRWATQERYYVYISFRYGKPVEASLYSLGEASGSAWHDLHFAARHWHRMEEIHKKPGPGRKGGETHYSIMAYCPTTGRIRKVEQTEIDVVLATPPEVTSG